MIAAMCSTRTLPFGNLMALRELLRAARNTIRWWEQHMPPKVLEVLYRELDGEKRPPTLRSREHHAGLEGRLQALPRRTEEAERHRRTVARAHDKRLSRTTIGSFSPPR